MAVVAIVVHVEGVDEEQAQAIADEWESAGPVSLSNKRWGSRAKGTVTTTWVETDDGQVVTKGAS